MLFSLPPSRSLPLFILGLFSLTCFANDIQPGFYKITDSKLAGTLGKVIFVHPEEVVKGTPSLMGINVFKKMVRVVNTEFSFDFTPAEVSRFPMEFQGADFESAVSNLKLDWDSSLKKKSKTKFIAHRGSPYLRGINPDSYYPANTLDSFETALKSGFQGFELDVHLTTDGHLVVSHDNDLSVSSTCEGKITEHKLADISQCQVIRSGLTPESRIESENAKIASPIPTLQEVFDRFLSDSRLQYLTVDVKPGDFAGLNTAIFTMLYKLTKEQRQKLIFLFRNPLLVHYVVTAYPYIHAALEGNTGWELLSYVTRERYFAGNTLSFNVGLGMGMFNERTYVPAAFEISENLIHAIPPALERTRVDFSDLGWTPENTHRYREVIQEAEQQSKLVLAWTINSTEKINLMNAYANPPGTILTDLSFSQVAQMQLRWLADSI